MEKKLKAQAKRDAKKKKKKDEMYGGVAPATSESNGRPGMRKPPRIDPESLPDNVILDENGYPMKNPFL